MSRPTAVEAAVHYLDLTVELPTSPPPDPASLRLVRRVLDGSPVPVDWDDRRYALKGTGRVPLTDEERSSLGTVSRAVTGNKPRSRRSTSELKAGNARPA